MDASTNAQGKGTRAKNLSIKQKGEGKVKADTGNCKGKERRAENKRRAMDASQPPGDRLYLSLSLGGLAKHERTKKGN